MIQVTKLPDNVSEDHLTLYFEREGGVEVEHAQLSGHSNSAIITFSDASGKRIN